MYALCPLCAWTDSIYLWSLLSAKSYALVPHWLKHYRTLGVKLSTNVELMIEGHGEDLRHVINYLNRENVQNYNVYGNVSDARLVVGGVRAQGLAASLRAGVNAFIARLPVDAWLIWCDVDEFFTWPHNITALIQSSNYMAVCGRMQDRVAADWTLASVQSENDLSQQFPICTRMRRDLLGGLAIKITLIRAYIDGTATQFVTAHTATNGMRTFGGYRRQRCFVPTPATFAHYSTTNVALKLALVKKNDFIRNDNALFSQTYSKFASLVINKSTFAASARRRLISVSEPCNPR